MASLNYVIGYYNCLTNQHFSMKDFREGKLEGLYIPELRRELEKECGVDSVNEVFGEPTHLEKAEAMFLRRRQLEQDGMLDFDKEVKYEYLIEISYEISYACSRELDSNNLVCDKYAGLFAGIPIEIFSWRLKKEKQQVTAKELEIVKNWLNLREAGEDSQKEKRLYLEYIFEAVSNSLEKIFKEVKEEIMSKEQKSTL